jgi:hypothetical protein
MRPRTFGGGIMGASGSAAENWIARVNVSSLKPRARYNVRRSSADRIGACPTWRMYFSQLRDTKRP